MSFVSKLFAPIAVCALALSGLPAAAQQQAPQVVSQFDDLTIRYLLDEMQTQWTIERGADGSLVYRASAEGEMNFTLAARDCRAGEGCSGLILVAIFTGLQANNIGQLDAYLHDFNDRNPTAKLIRTPEGYIALQSYINARGGISYRNVQAQMLRFGEDIRNSSRALAYFEQSQ